MAESQWAKAGGSTSFLDPLDVTVDAAGVAYVITSEDDGRIYKLHSDGRTEVIAGSSEKRLPPLSTSSIERPIASADGTLYAASRAEHVVMRLTPDGLLEVVAGSGEPGFKDGRGSEAAFAQPGGLAFLNDGSFYVADLDNHVIRHVSVDGTVTTLAGGRRGDQDGPASEAGFAQPEAVAVGPDGSLYVADSMNRAIRRIDLAKPERPVTTVVVEGSADEAGLSSFHLVSDSQGVAYYVLPGTHQVKRITLDGRVESFVETTPASQAGADACRQHDGRLTIPPIVGLAIAPGGDLLVADALAARLRQFDATGKEVSPSVQLPPFSGPSICPGLPDSFAVDPTGALHLIRGTQERITYRPDGRVERLELENREGYADGPASEARFKAPSGLAIATDGKLFVADTGNHRIRQLDLKAPGLPVTTLAGGPAGNTDGQGTQARFQAPRDLVIDPTSGDLLIADTGNSAVRRLTRAGVVTTVESGIEANAIACDGSGQVYVASNDAVRRLGSSTIPGGGDLTAPVGLAVDGRGRVYVADWSEQDARRGVRVSQITPAGDRHVVLETEQRWTGGWGLLFTPALPGPPSFFTCGLAVSPDDALYVADRSARKLYRIADLP